MARQFASAAVGALALLAVVAVLSLSPVSARMEQAPATLAPSPVAPVILSDSNSSVPLTPPPLPSAAPANASVPTAPDTNATAPASNSSSPVPTTPPTPPVRPPFPRPADLERKTCELSPEQKKYCDERYLRWRQIPSFCRAERRVQRAKARSALEAARQVYKEAVRAAKDAEAADKASTDLAVQAVADLRRKEAIRVAREVRRTTFKRVREERRRAIRESEANCKKHRARLARKLQKKCSLRRCLQHNCHWSRRNIGVQRQLCSREYVEARYTHRLKIFQARKDDELERARLRLSRRASMKATTSYADRVTIRTIYNEKYATQKALFEDAITKEKQRWLIFKADHATACKMRDAEASSTSTALCALVKSYRYRY